MNAFCVPRTFAAMTNEESGTLTYTASRKIMESPQTKQSKESKSMFPLNEPITKYSARLIRKQMLAGGRRLNKADRRYLKHMIDYGRLLDAESFHILINLLLTAPQED